MMNENLRRDEAALRSSLLTIASYEVHLDLREAADPEVAGFLSRSTVTFSCDAPGSETFMDFIADEVHRVTLNGTDLDPAVVVDGARITLPDLAADNVVTITGTALYSRSGEGMHRFTDPADGQTYLYTQYEPADARRVFANFEQPDLKAAFTFSVSAPADWVVASNGAEATREDGGEGSRVWQFAPTERISTYITTILAGPYFAATDHWSGTMSDGSTLEIPLGLYCRASLAEAFDTDTIFDVTKRGLEYFHSRFEYPYPFGKYEQAFVPEYNLGAMENPGLVTFTEAYIFRSKATHDQYEARANTILHEMAHMWFGDLVTMFWWDDLWLKESFADYMGALAVAEATGSTTSWVSFANRRKAWAYLQDQLPSTHPITADIVDLEAAKQNFDGITYAKGASVLKQLVAYAGSEAFFEAARAYFRTHAFGNTRLTDLLSALSDATGQDMTAWAQQWLQTSGVPLLSAEVEVDDDGAYRAVVIHQDATDPVTGAAALRPHQLRLGLYSFAAGALVRTGAVDVRIDGAATDVPELVGVVQPDLLLINDDDLTYAKISFDERSLATLLGSVGCLEEPLARAVCQAALWSNTRDAALSSAAYVGAVQLAAPGESGVGALQVMLRNAHYAVEYYSPADEREVLRERLFSFVVEGLHAAEPASDLQLVWARAAAALGLHSNTHSGWFRELLGGKQSVTGLAVDPELRWLLWQALAAQGQASGAELEAELDRDRTAAGKAGFTRASTSVPDAAIKEKAWQEAVFGTRLSNELLSATIAGFAEGPAELRAPYVDRYFAEIGRVWDAMGIEMASRIVRGLFPGSQDLTPGEAAEEHRVVLAADNWLTTYQSSPAALRRIVLEERDHLLRSLHAQGKVA
ncbi:aminopeptidase N [Arthrobacter sp. Bz4]|uniref:aminopeptidase N n=1 Tax=Arthrobacter sp. Bz4 TaxID=2171979 RepID=UPI000D514760|nr:aminopeptidase N [Arthrobacter sp. Bz4]PVE19844.1 aminopeptidase N [Arthrobacter sp. Bz4]